MAVLDGFTEDNLHTRIGMLRQTASVRYIAIHAASVIWVTRIMHRELQGGRLHSLEQFAQRRQELSGIRQ